MVEWFDLNARHQAAFLWIWRPHPEFEGLRVSIGPLIEDGLKLGKMD